MSIDEAIKHCEEVAEKNEKECKNWAYGASQINDDENRKKQYQKHAEMWHECANEHRQLAKWLRELKAYEVAREEIIRKRDSGQWSEAVVFGFNHAIYIIDKHLKEVNADEDCD